MIKNVYEYGWKCCKRSHLFDTCQEHAISKTYKALGSAYDGDRVAF